MPRPQAYALPLLAAAAVLALIFITTADSEPAPPAQTIQAGSFSVVEVNARYQGKTVRWWAKRAVQARKDANARGRTIARLRSQLENVVVSPTLAIRFVFGHHADEALRVSWCESRWDNGARNGQYLGLFQMGSSERERWGHSWDPVVQAQAAYRYFVASGRDWSPWDPRCRP